MNSTVKSNTGQWLLTLTVEMFEMVLIRNPLSVSEDIKWRDGYVIQVIYCSNVLHCCCQMKSFCGYLEAEETDWWFFITYIQILSAYRLYLQTL